MFVRLLPKLRIVTHLSLPGVQVEVKDWMCWERQMNSRYLTFEDGHISSTHVDMAQSTWILTRNEKGKK